MNTKKFFNRTIKAALIGSTVLGSLLVPSASFAQDEGPFFIVEHNPATDKYWKAPLSLSSVNSCKTYAEQIKKGSKASPSNASVFDRKDFRYYCVTESELSGYTLEN